MGKKIAVFTETLFRALFCVLILIHSSCSSRLDDMPVRDGDGYLSLSFCMLETKADISDGGSGTFSEGDRIGLYVAGDAGLFYRELTYQGGEWLPKLKRSDFGSGTLSLSAHYPAAGEDKDPSDHVLDISVDQNDGKYAAEDLLVSQTVLESGSDRAEMYFRHAMHRLKITLSGTDDETVLKVRSITHGKIDLLTGEAEISGSEFNWITPCKNTAGDYSAILIPQSAMPYRDGDGLVHISAGDRQVTYNAPEKTQEGNTLISFEAGKQTSVRLSVKPGNPDLAGRVLWVYGVNAPAFPGKDAVKSYPIAKTYGFPAGEWGRYDYSWDEVQFLTWSETCGWYDCNKSAEYDENDKNLCWAASASSTLTWWLVNNKAYIDAYDAEYGSSITTDSGVFERPSSDFKPLYPEGPGGPVNRSPVFEFFKSHFPDMGNWNAGAVNWFINGSSIGSDINGFRGFFPEVFSMTDKVAEESDSHPTKEDFNRFMVDALLNRKAIGFSVNDFAGSGTGNHSMTIWGAEFGSDGYISHLYYCDNNWADQDQNGACIHRKEVVYYSSTPGSTVLRTYIKKLEPEDPIYPAAKYLIVRVYSVDLRQDLWKNKFPSVSSGQ